MVQLFGDHHFRCSGQARRPLGDIHRHVGDAPLGADLIPPTVQDGYLVLNGEVPDERVA